MAEGNTSNAKSPDNLGVAWDESLGHIPSDHSLNQANSQSDLPTDVSVSLDNTDEAPNAPKEESRGRIDRADIVKDLQKELREKNNLPEVGGKMMVEMPLGDDTDRVVQVLRPDAIDAVLPPMDEDFNSKLPDGSHIDAELMRNFAHQRVAVILPEVGMTWINTDRSIKPDTIKSEVTKALDHQGQQPRSFLELAKKEGLKFALHGGMEKDDKPSFIPDEMIDPQGATIIQRNPGREDDQEAHWQEGVAIGIMETVRGDASSEMFNLAIKGAFGKAKDQIKFQGPSPDNLIDSTRTTVLNLK